MNDDIRPLTFDPEHYPEDRETKGDCPAAPCSRVHGPLMFAGCGKHRSRTDLSCSKIRRVSDGKALTALEVWEVLCENAEAHRDFDEASCCKDSSDDRKKVTTNHPNHRKGE